ncbi:MAG: protein translocase subunit SecD [Sedimentisphaerales bacterium]|nr:protein translocase subunit SecD [Sedimentisphaerales bacterium]
MDRNLARFGFVAIIILVAFAVSQLYPPEKTLKPGLDLAGGTSLIYEIDTTGLQGNEVDNLAQKLAPTLLKRIDPGNVQNIIMRPQGDTRLEIQVPLASADTHLKRQAYDDALEAIAKDNINLAIIKRTLAKDPAQRDEDFAKFAGDSDNRKEILAKLSLTYDARKIAQDERDDLKSKLNTITDKLENAGIDNQSLSYTALSWNNLDPNKQSKQIDELIADANTAGKIFVSQQETRQQIEQYLDIYQQWAQVVNKLTEPETGLNAAYRQAERQLRDFNLSTDVLVGVLEMPAKSVSRADMIQQLKNNFPSKEQEIDNLVKVFEEYRPVRGRIDGPEDVKRMLKGAGVLEFRILPKLDDGRTKQDEILTYIEALKTKGPKLASDSKYVWIEIEDKENNSWRQTENNQIIIDTFADKYYVLASNQKDECLLKGSGQKAWKLQKAGHTVDQMGKRAIDFMFDEVGAGLFYNVTRNNLQRPLCIILDGMAISSPNIRSAIRSRGVIEGDFSAVEQTDMVDKLNAGSLPARLIEPPISEKTIGPIIGADNRTRGIKAGQIGLIAVAIFIFIYYTFAGSIADLALFMNILFVLAIMALSRATFTLPGIAGIILTIGMSVDANVLIFERIREEQLKGSSLRIAIDSGYQRAFSTILDANITTFITAMILYMVASEEIKGFALTLMLGIGSSMFTALFVTRVIFQLLLDKGIIRNHLTMRRIIKDPKINWMKIRMPMLIFSVIMVAGGLSVFYTRDDEANNKYDIEFTGGTSIQINLKPECAMDRSEVEEIIRQEGAQLNNNAIAAAKVYSVGDKESKTQYEITTTETNKTTSELLFYDETERTIAGITAAILNAQKSVRGVMFDLSVKQDPQNTSKFIVTTSQANRYIVSAILSKAFDTDKSAVVISDPKVDEIVSRAVKEAFEGKLQIMENLKPNITSTEKIDDSVLDKMPELGDFLGGIKINFTVEKPVTLAEINKRLKELQFKPDMQDIIWNSYELYDSDLNTQNEEKLTEFVYVSAEADAGYRQLSEDEWNRFTANETTKITTAGTMQTSLPRVTQIAPSVGQQAKTRAIVAIVLSILAIIAYIWIRFGTLRYGIAATVALVHDVSITLGVITGCTYIAGTPLGQALLIGDFKIDLAMIAAFLTIIGYSLNDTIVVFDRIRENRGKLATISPELITNSINQTLSRTLLTSLTTFLAVIVMYIWGGPGLRGFTFAMLVGIIVGTYSSIAIAAPLLILGKKLKKTK